MYLQHCLSGILKTPKDTCCVNLLEENENVCILLASFLWGFKSISSSIGRLINAISLKLNQFQQQISSALKGGLPWLQQIGQGANQVSELMVAYLLWPDVQLSIKANHFQTERTATELLGHLGLPQTDVLPTTVEVRRICRGFFLQLAKHVIFIISTYYCYARVG